VLQVHATQVQTLQNELKSLRAQLANLKGKSSQPTSHAQPIQSSGSREGPLKSFYGLSHDAMVGECVISSAHNSNLTPKFPISFCPSYFTTQKVNVAPKVFATRRIIQTNGPTYSSSILPRLEELEQSLLYLLVHGDVTTPFLSHHTLASISKIVAQTPHFSQSCKYFQRLGYNHLALLGHHYGY
jgi:hypothetical protein